MDANDRRINPEDELFWKKVREAYDVVVPVTGKTVTVQVGTKEAMVVAVDPIEGGNFISITIKEFVPDPPTLVVP